MKNNRNIFRSIIGLAAAASLVACDNDDLYLGSADTDILGSAAGNVVYITDGNGHGDVSFVEFSGNRTIDLFARSSKPLSGDCTVRFAYDASVLAQYNASQPTEVPAFPQANVTFSGTGAVTLASGKTVSDAMTVTMTAADGIDPSATYAIPLKVTASNAILKDNAEGYIILVQDCTSFPGADKTYNGEPGMKIIGVLEVNDQNPLNVLPFTLKGSGKQLFDMVVLFSANINYDSTTGRVYVSRNENVQAILDNREKYIKPLQDRGIKVILGVMGNHDISGICTLSPELSKQFAQEVKTICDVYELDGVFLDDEWTDYNGAAASPLPGFHEATYDAASQMAYDIKQAQPDRLLLIYRFFALANGVAINGVQPGDFVDYVLNDYWDTGNPCPAWPGLRMSQAGTCSWNCTEGNQEKAQWFPGEISAGKYAYNDFVSLPALREDGYGALMIFNFYCNPSARLTPKIISALELTTRAFYDAELEYDGSWYPKDY